MTLFEAGILLMAAGAMTFAAGWLLRWLWEWRQGLDMKLIWAVLLFVSGFAATARGSCRRASITSCT